jgi:hypothetical protein
MIDKLGAVPVSIQIPIGKEDQFRGSIDLVKMKAYFFDDETLGAKFVEGDIPAEYAAQAKEYRDKMLEAIADIDESLMEKYLGGEEISEAEIKAAIRKGTVFHGDHAGRAWLCIQEQGCSASARRRGDYLRLRWMFPPSRACFRAIRSRWSVGLPMKNRFPPWHSRS